jgi:radical SAM protein with 4Fe4S-binding SPASM domain
VTGAASGVYTLALQSNLYSVSDEKIALLKEFQVGLSFSYDVIPGVRLNVLGKPTEAAVEKNIQRIRGMGIKLAGIAVLAKHTVARVTEVYDFYARHGMDMRILPLFDGPEERHAEHFMVDHGTMIAALDRLFRHWMATGCKVQIRPFDLFFQSALRHMTNLELVKVDRAVQGDHVLLVNVDGSVYRVLDAYVAELSLGNLATQTIDELLDSEPYAASLVRDREEFDRHCGGCTYRMACNGQFVYDSRVTFPYEGSCVTAWHCIRFMEQFIRDRGYENADIESLLATVVENMTRSGDPSLNAAMSPA